MSKSIFAPPDTFSVSPLLSLLPVRSQVGTLQPLTSFFYARYERVAGMRREIEGRGDPEALRHISAEAAMLREVLDYLKVTPSDEKK